MRGPGNSNPGVACLNKKVPVHDPAVETETITMDAAAAEREKSFSAFVASHRERAIRLAWQCIGGDEAAAEDVAQEAFMKAYKSLETFRADASLGTWFYRILIRQAQNYRRWRLVREVWNGGRQENSQENSLDIPVDENLGDPGLRQRITHALNQLSQRQREAFILVYLEGFTVRECAEVLGKPHGTVSSHLHRARTLLRAELADLYECMEES